jgi:PAS domain S-box-containing protein
MAFILYSYFGVFVLNIDIQSRAFRSFFYLCATFAWWSLMYTFYFSAEDIHKLRLIYRIASIAWIPFPMVMLNFCVQITGDKILFKKLVPALGLISAFFLFRSLTEIFYARDFIRIGRYWFFVFDTGPWTIAYLGFFFCCMVISTYLIFTWGIKAKTVKQKKQANIMFISFAVNYLLSPAFNVFFPAMGIYILPESAHLIALPFIFGAYYAIRKYKLLVLTPEIAADAITESVTDVLIFLNREGEITRVNNRFTALLGFNPSEVRGLRIDSILRSQPFKGDFVDGKVTFEGELSAKKGKPISVRITGSLIRDEFGDEVGIILAAHDLKIEKNLETARIHAEYASRAKSEFLANMSHEIRTPISGITGVIDLLIEDMDDPVKREYLTMAKDAAKNLISLVSDILDFSKIEAGNQSLELEEFEIAPLIKTIKSTFLVMSREKGLRFAIRTEGQPSGRYIGDQDKLRQVLINLIANSVKFTDSGEVIVTITPSRAEEEGRETLTFLVSDSGPGIPEEKRNLLFKQFSQIDASTSKRHRGTGLGLAISKRLVEMMGGRIWHENREEGGSIFGFSVSLLVATSPPKPEEEKKSESGEKTANILLVEDNVLNQLFITEQLKRAGHRVSVAGNGQEAVEMAKFLDPDIILMDIQLPDTDGIETVKIIRENKGTSHPPIIALSAYAVKGDRERFIEAGMNDYISKPFEMADLKKLIQHHIGQKGIQTEPADGKV